MVKKKPNYIPEWFVDFIDFFLKKMKKIFHMICLEENMVKCVMLNINARLHMLVPLLKELFNFQLLLF